MILAVICSGALIWKIFDLQIVQGEEYLENFQLTIQKEISIPATRGNIYDRNNKGSKGYLALAEEFLKKNEGRESWQ